MDWRLVLPNATFIGDPPPAVSDVTHDSRLVRRGAAFVAVPGFQSDGHAYLQAAFDAGAAVLVVQADRPAAWADFRGRAPIVVVDDTRRALGPIAAAAHDYPSRSLRLIGVTGTDGKTTTSHLTAHVLDRCGLACGYLSSVAFDTGAGAALNARHMTTLEASEVQSLLAAAVTSGRKSMVVEASSEGLAQYRLAGCEVDVAVFTNLTRDHLDFHGTMEAYLAAKGLLFEMLETRVDKPYAKAAILNADDASIGYLRERSDAPVISYGVHQRADLRASAIESDSTLRFQVAHNGSTHQVEAPLFGRFNVYNCLAALGVALSQGVALGDAVAALASFTGVPGRMERIDSGQPFQVVVDIASTETALTNVLAALREATTGRLWVVFGAAGGRDPARRDGLGRAAARLADRAVITNEDPRQEDPAAIIATIAAAMIANGRAEGRDFVRIPDRRSAIRHAFENAAAGDTVLLAGKATETTMVFADGDRPWDERAVARELLGG